RIAKPSLDEFTHVVGAPYSGRALGGTPPSPPLSGLPFTIGLGRTATPPASIGGGSRCLIDAS
ncbi:unnamed protein product, partial [Musa acuminata var. zebrina]